MLSNKMKFWLFNLVSIITIYVEYYDPIDEFYIVTNLWIIILFVMIVDFYFYLKLKIKIN